MVAKWHEAKTLFYGVVSLPLPPTSLLLACAKQRLRPRPLSLPPSLRKPFVPLRPDRREQTNCRTSKETSSSLAPDAAPRSPLNAARHPRLASSSGAGRQTTTTKTTLTRTGRWAETSAPRRPAWRTARATRKRSSSSEEACCSVMYKVGAKDECKAEGVCSHAIWSSTLRRCLY